MRTLKRRDKEIKLLAPTMATGSMGGVTKTWTGTKTVMRGAVQPLSSSTSRQEYGERVENMKLVIVQNNVHEIGDGVWIDEISDKPEYIIVSKSAWMGLTSFVVEKQ